MRITLWSRALIEKSKHPRRHKKLPAFCSTRRFITVFTTARHVSLSSARSIQSKWPHPTFLKIQLQARSKNCEKRLLASSRLSVCPSVHMEQLGSHWADFHDIWYRNFFSKSVQKIQFSLKSDRITGTIHADLYTFWMKSCSISNNRAVYEITWKVL